jgi:hypothetical protein
LAWTWARSTARIALEESQDWSCAASGCEAMSLFVFLLYDSKAAIKIVSKVVEEVAIDGTWDIVIVKWV